MISSHSNHGFPSSILSPLLCYNVDCDVATWMFPWLKYMHSSQMSKTFWKILQGRPSQCFSNPHTQAIGQGMWALFGSFFMLSNFYKLDSHNETSVALANLQWRISKRWIEGRTTLDIRYDYQTACLLIPSLNTQVLPISFAIRCGVINKLWRHSLISLKYVSFLVFFFL